MVNAKHINLVGAKHVMRYLKGNLDYGITYTSNRARSYYMDLQIQIGQEALKIERGLQDVVLFWDHV